MREPEIAVLFYDRRAPETLLRRFASAEKIPAGTLEPRMLRGREKQTILLALPNAALGSAAAACGEAGCKNVYVLPTENGASADPVRADVTKPRLDYLETEITRRCNLHCRGCCDFIQLAGDEEPFYALEAFTRDLTQIKRFFWGVGKIRLMGGEPLLSRQIAAYAEQARSVLPDCDLRIVTNGLLIPSLSPQTLQRLKNCGCSFDISNYPPTGRRKKEIVSILRKAGVSYDVGVPMRFFFRNIAETPSRDPGPAFRNCLFTHCHMLMEGGRLAPCSFAGCIPRLNRRFGTEYPENDWINLYDTELDGWQICNLLSSPHPFCACCTRGMVPIRWKNGVDANSAAIEDWIVRADVWSECFAPAVQRLMKPAADALRSFIQRKKI